MISNKAVGSIALVIIAVAGLRALAEEKSASELYGQGVHAYFAGDYNATIGYMTASIDKRATDPRPFYFRGLALAGLHGLEAGLDDLAKGADVEVNKMDQRVYDVNSSLQRVQGALRLAIEQQRTAARVAAAERKKKQDRVRYEELQRREDVVVYDPKRPAKKVDLQIPTIDLGEKNPFTSGIAFTGGKEVAVAPTAPEVTPAPAESGTTAAADAPRDPFSGTAEETPMAEEPEDPFGSGTASTRKKPAAKPKAAAEPAGDNPFGDTMPEADPGNESVFDDSVRPQLPPGMNVGGTIINVLGKTFSGAAGHRDPFGDSDDTTPPEDAKTAEPPAEAPGDDPFGGSSDAAAPKSKAKADPAADDDDSEADPFGGSGDAKSAPAPGGDQPAAKKPAEPSDDPFK